MTHLVFSDLIASRIPRRLIRRILYGEDSEIDDREEAGSQSGGQAGRQVQGRASPAQVGLTPMEDMLSLLQWPAMAISLAAAWWMGSKQAGERIVAFVMLSIGNLMWIAWGWSESAFALIALNAGLLALNIRGIMKNEEAT